MDCTAQGHCQLFAVVKRVVEAHSRREPAVTLIEDVQ
jgi:hypothetical protein